MTAPTMCARCERPADADDQCVVIVLGSPMCAACAADWQARRDAEEADKAEGQP